MKVLSIILNVVKDLGVIVLLLFLIKSPVSASSTISRLTIPLTSNSTLVISTTDSAVDKKIIISDHLSSTRVILNEDGSKSADLLYYPYGAERVRLSGSTNNRYYTGQKKVSDISPLYNYNARFYNPTIGVFTQPDMVEGPNRFAYVASNPITFADKSGHDKLDLTMIDDGRTGSSIHATGIYDPDLVDKDIPKSLAYGALAFSGGALAVAAAPALVVGAFNLCVGGPVTCGAVTTFVAEMALGDALPPGASMNPVSAATDLSGLRGTILAEIEAGAKNVTMTTVNPIIDDLIAQGMSHEDALALVGHSIKPPYGRKSNVEQNIGQIMIDHQQGRRGPPTVDEWVSQEALVCLDCANLVGVMAQSRGFTPIFGEFSHLPHGGHAVAGIVKDGVTRVLDILNFPRSMGVEEFSEIWAQKVGRITSEIHWE